jgi:hypothetical protein
MKQMQFELLNKCFKTLDKNDGKLWPQPYMTLSGAMVIAQNQKEYDKYCKLEVITIIGCVAAIAIGLTIFFIWF